MAKSRKKKVLSDKSRFKKGDLVIYQGRRKSDLRFPSQGDVGEIKKKIDDTCWLVVFERVGEWTVLDENICAAI